MSVPKFMVLVPDTLFPPSIVPDTCAFPMETNTLPPTVVPAVQSAPSDSPALIFPLIAAPFVADIYTSPFILPIAPYTSPFTLPPSIATFTFPPTSPSLF